MVILSCTQNQTTQSEKKQTKQIQSETKGGNSMVIMSTSLGDIKIELYQDKAPITVQNFLSYVNDGFFDDTIFHRVIPNFMIQGGGFTQDMKQKPTKAPIKNEADNGLKNDAGTISMARTGVVDSATSQFFINQADNDFLNHSSRDFGYAVFGKVVEGMDVVNKIAGVNTGRLGPFQDVPLEPVVINSVRLVESERK
ncbi:MAG: peptidyl-prolyl cis-trans isomerase [Deltaproteobacteria bacterium]|nr:peptidyl-prolyl cis-trans isomerase [Deltaproteobacteria bacterium]